ncbi:MAG TPA: hypothetical protein PKM63_05425 [Panacibacter sp.]|nr:hypothetical protein [Panacibacter sp.]HNP43703.1 hypothetical protein [Panacibacter sp.]
MLDNLNETLKDQLSKAKETINTTVEKLADVKDFSSAKIAESFEELTAALPLIEEAGFKVDGISVDVGLPPDFSIGFTKMNEVKPEAIQKLIDDNTDKKLLSMVLRALMTATDIQSKVTLNKFVFSGASVKLGIPPSISLKYK